MIHLQQNFQLGDGLNFIHIVSAIPKNFSFRPSSSLTKAEISTSAGTSWNEDGKANQKFSRRASLRSPHTFVGEELCGFGFIKLVQVNWSWLLGTFYGRLAVIIWVFSIDQQSWTSIVTTSSACIIQYQLSNGFFNADILYARREVFTAVDNHQLLVLLANIANLILLTRSDL